MSAFWNTSGAVITYTFMQTFHVYHMHCTRRGTNDVIGKGWGHHSAPWRMHFDDDLFYRLLLHFILKHQSGSFLSQLSKLGKVKKKQNSFIIFSELMAEEGWGDSLFAWSTHRWCQSDLFHDCMLNLIYSHYLTLEGLIVITTKSYMIKLLNIFDQKRMPVHNIRLRNYI